MKKITVITVLALLCGYLPADGQQFREDFRQAATPLYIDSWLRQDVPLGRFINYTDTTATLSSFTGKWVVLSFWFIACASCIKEFPKEDSLQKVFGDRIQLILVTFDNMQKVKNFISRWEKNNNTRFNLPLIVEDSLLSRAFHFRYNPHYIWIRPDGKIAGQTTPQFMTAATIEELLRIPAQ